MNTWNYNKQGGHKGYNRDPLHQDHLDACESDPVDHFYHILRVAKLQASEKRFAAAYQTLVIAYDNLLDQHEEVVEEVLELRKKVSLSI